VKEAVAVVDRLRGRGVVIGRISYLILLTALLGQGQVRTLKIQIQIQIQASISNIRFMPLRLG
jgi:hypothetical protein